MKKPVMLDDQQIQRLMDLVYEEYDAVTGGSTSYTDRGEAIYELRELLDTLQEAKENGA